MKGMKMTLKELFAPYPSDQKVYVTVTNGEFYEGVIADCPIHILGNEVQKARSIDDELVVKVKVEVDTMTWDELRRAIQSMPEWARAMPARIYIDRCKRYTSDEDHGISTILTYYGKEPSEIQDDGVDFVVMDIDAPFVQ